MQYDFTKQIVVTHRAAVDLATARGDIADFVTDHRRASNALISDWREFYQLVLRWDGDGVLSLSLPDDTAIVAGPLTEGALRRVVQDKRRHTIVEKSLEWVVNTYNTDQKEDA